MKIVLDVARQQIRIKTSVNEILEFISEAALIEHFLEHVSIGGVESGGALVPPHPASRFRVQVPSANTTTGKETERPTAKKKAPTSLKKHAAGVKKVAKRSRTQGKK